MMKVSIGLLGGTARLGASFAHVRSGLVLQDCVKCISGPQKRRFGDNSQIGMSLDCASDSHVSCIWSRKSIIVSGKF